MAIVYASKLEYLDKEAEDKIVWTLGCLEGLVAGTINGVYLAELLDKLDE